MIISYVVLGLIVLILVFVLIHIAEAKGRIDSENARIKDVLKAKDQAHARMLRIIDDYTKSKHNFEEKFSTARTPNDFVDLANSLLDLEPHAATVAESPTRPVIQKSTKDKK